MQCKVVFVIPFIVSGPKITPGKESKTSISFSDILPTIIDICELKKGVYFVIAGLYNTKLITQ